MTRGRWILVGLLLALIAGNAGYLIYRATSPAPALLTPTGATSTDVLVARAIDPDTIVAGTRGNDLVLIKHGSEIARTTLDGSLRDLAVTPGSIVTGDSSGVVTRFDHSLQLLSQTRVEGQVSALVPTDDGGIIVVHGPGGYANRATLSLYPEDLPAEPAGEFDVPFNVTAVAVQGDTLYIGTLNSRVQARSLPDGAEQWTTTLSQPVSMIATATGDDHLLVGDGEGGVTFVSTDGSAGNRTVLGTAALRAATFDPGTQRWITGDANGRIAIIDQSGAALYNSQIANRDIALVTPTSDETMLVVPREGVWQSLDTTALDATRNADRLSGARWIVSIALMLGILGLAPFQHPVSRRILERIRIAIWKSRLAYLFILPSLILVGVFTYYPTFMSIYYSFTNFSIRNETEFVGLQNYVKILRDDFYFRTGITNMVIMTAAGIIKTLTMPLLAAELVYWLRNNTHQYVYRTLFVLPAVVPDLVFALLWRQVYDPNSGLLNQILRLIGLDSWQRGWLGNDSTALWAIIWVGFPFISAFAFLIYLGGLLNINADYFDASKIDGASAFSRFRNIDVPLLIPQFRIMLFFAFSGTVQGFASIFILTGGGPGYATYVPALQMFLRISDGEFGYASAIGVILFIMVCIATYFVLHFRKQSIEDA